MTKKHLNDAVYDACLNKKGTWSFMAEEYNFKDGETLRNLFRQERKSRGEEKIPSSSSMTVSDNGIDIVCNSDRILSSEDVIKKFEVDTSIWEVDSYTISVHEGYRKDRSVEWDVEDGVVTNGKVRDSGKLLVVPMYSIKVKLKKKHVERNLSLILQQFKEDIQSASPRTNTIIRKPVTGGNMLELAIPDIHFGRLTWHEETGENYDIKIAHQTVMDAVDNLISNVNPDLVDKIMIPIGNDFYNVNSMDNKTQAGTPQQEDVRWQKTFRAGRALAVEMIERCRAIAPVSVIVVRGNHDVERIFYLGEVLDAMYSDVNDVDIDNGPMARKYKKYWNNMIMYTHGNNEKVSSLPMIMASEQPIMWGETQNREIHIGHKHHKWETEDFPGVTIRQIRSLVPEDAWTFEHGYVQSPRGAEAYLWNKTRGIVANFTYTV